jgi:hypothetical protein
MEMVADSQRLVALDVVEVNPILDHPNSTAKPGVEFDPLDAGEEYFAAHTVMPTIVVSPASETARTTFHVRSM